MKTNKKFIVIALSFALLFSGCTQQKEYVRDQWASDAATVSEYVMKTLPLANPIVKVDTKDCQYCKGTGILKSGDGLHQEKCPYCEDKGGSVGEEAVVPVKQVAVVEPSLKKCCQDCICDGECKCRYAGECLVKKHNGWAVQVCDETECRVYFPHDSLGTKYNPYDLLTAAQKARPEYKMYANPIKLDVYGEEVQSAVTQQTTVINTAQPIRRMRSGCASCAR